MNRLSLPLVRSRLRARFFSTEKKKPIKIFGGRKKKGGTRKKSPTEQTTATSTTRAHRAHGKPRQTSGAGHTYAPKSRSGYNQKLKQKKTDGHASGDAYAVDAAELAQFRQSQSTYLPLLGVSIPAGALYFILNDLYIGQNSSWSERASSVVQDVHVAVNERRGKTRCDREEEKRQSLTNANADESSYSGILGMFQGWNDLSYFSFIDLAYFRDYFVSAEDEQVQAKHDSTIGKTSTVV